MGHSVTQQEGLDPDCYKGLYLIEVDPPLIRGAQNTIPPSI